MERLTFDGNFCDIAQCRELPCPHGGNCTQRKVWEKLKAYEDTWLEPEQCEKAETIFCNERRKALAFSAEMARQERTIDDLRQQLSFMRQAIRDMEAKEE